MEAVFVGAVVVQVGAIIVPTLAYFTKKLSQTGSAPTYKLRVEVASGHNLMLSKGQDSPNTYVELKFDDQRFRTATKEKDQNPVWDECFDFGVSDPSNLDRLALEARVYSVKKSSSINKSSLGSVKIDGASFLHFRGDAVARHYVLKKRNIFSHARGELALIVYIIVDEPSSRSPPLAAMDGAVMCSPDFHVPESLESMLHHQSSKPRDIGLESLQQMTNDFSEERIIGSGGFGVVYKGVLQNGDVVAVKKIKSSLMTSVQKQFENEVFHLWMLKHPNIVRFLGYCYHTEQVYAQFDGKRVFAEMTERLLCLEYLTMGSLDEYLSDESSEHEWSTRYKIIQGICDGLCYLHEKIDTPTIHLDLKPANILLDGTMVPKISDFGLSRLLGQQQTIRTATCLGTRGYMPPEFLDGGTISSKSDIFSLGVIIMEVITGHRDYPDATKSSSNDFVETALQKWRNMLENADGYTSLETDCQQIKRCIQVGLMCVNPDRTKRPKATEIVKMLQGFETIDGKISNENEATSSSDQNEARLWRDAGALGLGALLSDLEYVP